MRIRRLASAALVAVLLAVAVAIVNAQLPGVLKGVSKVPSVPGVKTAAGPAGMTTNCSSIDSSLIDKFIKAQAVRDKVYADEVANANANKAKADALAKKRATQTVNTMMQTAECTDAKKEKDPRTKEAARLEALLAAANERGDEAKANEIQKKLDPLNEAIEIDADRACGGRGIAALHDCIERKTAELSKQGLAGPMLQIQAQGACVSDPSTSGAAGNTAASAEEQAAQKAYEDGMANANAKADQAYADSLGQENDRKKALFVDCCYGVRHKDAVILSNSSKEFQDAIEARGSALDKVCK